VALSEVTLGGSLLASDFGDSFALHHYVMYLPDLSPVSGQVPFCR
jgi:hypothetical protein